MTTVITEAPSVTDVIATIHTLDFLIALSEDNEELKESLCVAGALAAATLKNQLVKEDKLPALGVKMLVLPFSEACMFLRVAGKRMWGVKTSEQEYAGVQLYTMDGQRFSIPITQGESGWRFA